MGKKIAWTEQAKANLRAIDQATALRILHAVGRYLATGEGDVKRLLDHRKAAARIADPKVVHPAAKYGIDLCDHPLHRLTYILPEHLL